MVNRYISFIAFAFVTLIQPSFCQESIRKCGVKPSNSPLENTIRLQKAIDKVSEKGGVIYVEPIEGGYPIKSGVVLKKMYQ